MILFGALGCTFGIILQVNHVADFPHLTEAQWFREYWKLHLLMIGLLAVAVGIILSGKADP